MKLSIVVILSVICVTFTQAQTTYYKDGRIEHQGPVPQAMSGTFDFLRDTLTGSTDYIGKLLRGLLGNVSKYVAGTGGALHDTIGTMQFQAPPGRRPSRQKRPPTTPPPPPESESEEYEE